MTNYTFNNNNTYRNVGIKTLDNMLVAININSTDNVSLHSSNNDTNIDTLSIKNILMKDVNKDLNLSSFNGTTINPIIQINNTQQHVNITSDLIIEKEVQTQKDIILLKKGSSTSAQHQGQIIFKKENGSTLSRIQHGDGSYGNLYIRATSNIVLENLETTHNNATEQGRVLCRHLKIGDDYDNPDTLGEYYPNSYEEEKLYVTGKTKLIGELNTTKKVHFEYLLKNDSGSTGVFFYRNSKTDNHTAVWHMDIGSGTLLNEYRGDLHFRYSNNANRTDGAIAGYLTAKDNVNTQMNFTGQHRCVPNKIDFYNNVDNYIGLIVYSIGKYKTYNSSEEKLIIDKEAITINDSLPIVDLSNKKKQKSVFGVISDKEEENRIYSAGCFCTPYPNKNDDKRLYINSLGEGAIWIVNTNGNLENGDYIQSSDVIGIGEKQDDDFLHSYTVAKITCDCDFILNSEYYKCVEFVDSVSGNTYRKAFVGCTYHCG